MEQLSLLDLLRLEEPTAMEQFWYWVDETNYTPREMQLIYWQPEDATKEEIDALVEKADSISDERIGQMLTKEYSYLYGNAPFQITDQKHAHLLAERLSDPEWRELDRKLDDIWYKDGNPNERVIWDRDEQQIRLKNFGDFCACNCHNQFLYIWKISEPDKEKNRTVKIWQYAMTPQRDNKSQIIHSVQLKDRVYADRLENTAKSKCSGTELMDAINDIFSYGKEIKEK